MSGNQANYDELRAAFDDIKQAQERLSADREIIKKRMLDAEPTWGPCCQCGHTWRSHNIRRRIGKPPRMCPKCRSHYWWDPDYVPTVPNPNRLPPKTAQATEPPPDAPTFPATEISPPPKAPRLVPDESVRFAEEDLTTKAKDNGNGN